MGSTVYNDCGCGSNSSSGSYLNPNLNCPPDLAQLFFRFIERKKVGMVQGKNEIMSIDMTSFFLPMSRYTLLTMTLCPDDIKKVDPAGISTTGKRREITEFDTSTLVSPTSLAAGSTATLVVTEGVTVIGTLTGIAADDYATFITSLKAAILADVNVKAAIEFLADNDPKFTIRGKTAGKYYTYTLTFTDSLLNNEVLAGTVTQTAERYPNANALKLIFAAIEFCDECGSNTQFVEYAYDSDYQANGLNADWRKTGKLFVLTGAEDVEEVDENLFETVWFRNTRECEVTIHLILGI